MSSYLFAQRLFPLFPLPFRTMEPKLRYRHTSSITFHCCVVRRVLLAMLASGPALSALASASAAAIELSVPGKSAPRSKIGRLSRPAVWKQQLGFAVFATVSLRQICSGVPQVRNTAASGTLALPRRGYWLLPTTLEVQGAWRMEPSLPGADGRGGEEELGDGILLRWGECLVVEGMPGTWLSYSPGCIKCVDNEWHILANIIDLMASPRTMRGKSLPTLITCPQPRKLSEGGSRHRLQQSYPVSKIARAMFCSTINREAQTRRTLPLPHQP